MTNIMASFFVRKTIFNTGGEDAEHFLPLLKKKQKERMALALRSSIAPPINS